MTISDFHPLYGDIVKLGFNQYMRQNFFREDAQLEIYFTTYYRSYTPELGGKFISLDTFERDGKEHKVHLPTLTLQLAFIGVNENQRKQKIGTKLLSDVLGMADKYNLRVELGIEEKFGVPKKVLRKWYEGFGFHYLSGGDMVRFSAEERIIKLHYIKDRWRDLLSDTSMIYLESSVDDGYSKESREDYLEIGERLKRYAEVEYWGYDDVFWIEEMVKESTYMVASFDREEHHPDYDTFITWAKEIVNKK